MMMIGDCTKSAKTVPDTGLGQESGRGRVKLVSRPSPDGDRGQGRSRDSSPGIYLDIYTVYLLRVSTALGF